MVDPDVWVTGHALDVDDTVRRLLLGPYQRTRLRYCVTKSYRIYLNQAAGSIKHKNTQS